ncbi:MAG: dihydropteroate synthase, partial [Fervidicoccaceae archaeon]
MTELEAHLGRVPVGDRHPVRVIGVINVSPESFYAGSVARGREEIARRAARLAEEGADIIDVGGRSTAPYLETEVPLEVEIERVAEAVEAVKSAVDVPISVDTFRARVAEEALKRGAEIVNDVTGLRGDQRMLYVLREYEPSLIVCASDDGVRAGPDPLEKILRTLRWSLERLEQIDYDVSRVVVDPCIGFFRRESIPWYLWDLKVLAGLRRLRELGRPIVVGVSRKSFIGVATGRERPEERLPGSLAMTAVALLGGAHAVRTHDVEATRDVARAIEAFARYGVPL